MKTAAKIVDRLLEAPKPEYVEQAAIRIPSGRVFTGKTHGFIRDAMARRYNDEEEGFVTNKGRFISRTAAYQLGVKTAQWTPKSYAQGQADAWGGEPAVKARTGAEAIIVNMLKADASDRRKRRRKK